MRVQVMAEVTGLEPRSNIGFHVHQFGSCRNQAMDAGSHFNPKGKSHGGPDSGEHHLGDLGNLEADVQGKAMYQKIIEGKVYSFFGRSIVVHGQTDDLNTQPTGGAGPRVACGLIGVAPQHSGL